ncbi:hypothetical protein Tco_0303231 [Tanacetum coccineum]
MKVITTRGGITLAGPSVPPHNSFSSSKEVEQDPEPIMDQVHISSSESTARVPSLVVQPSPASKPKEIPERNPHQPHIHYPSRLNKDKLQDKSDIQIHKFLQMVKKLYFNISFAEALAQMPKYAKMLKDLLSNKEKLLKLANTSLNENCSALEECMALADLGRWLLEKLLNNDCTKDLPLKELKNDEIKTTKSSIEEPPDLELKDLPPHLEYAFLEGTSKVRVIITKNLREKEKDQLIKVLKSHKRAIAWKISNIRGIDPNFCTHKILMEDDFKLAVQHQRMVSHVYVVPKKGGMTVVTNDNNELISTRLVTGWRVCIDYQKLNDTIRKDHFPLPFMDQMLERLAGKFELQRNYGL